MLGDITRSSQNMADYDPALAKAIDDYVEANVSLMKALDLAGQRIQRGQEVNGGKATVDAEAAMQLCQSMNTLAEQAFAATVANVGATSSFLLLKRRRTQGIVLDMKARG